MSSSHPCPSEGPLSPQPAPALGNAAETTTNLSPTHNKGTGPCTFECPLPRQLLSITATPRGWGTVTTVVALTQPGLSCAFSSSPSPWRRTQLQLGVLLQNPAEASLISAALNTPLGHRAHFIMQTIERQSSPAPIAQQQHSRLPVKML